MTLGSLGSKACLLRKCGPLFTLKISKDGIGLIDLNSPRQVRRCHIPASDKNILPAIVVKVSNVWTESGHRSTKQSHPAHPSDFGEAAVAVVEINWKSLILQCDHRNVRIPIVVKVAKIYAHAGDQAAILRKCHACLGCNFLEHGVPFVMEQKVGELIVGDKDVGKSVSIVVGDPNAHTLAGMHPDPCLCRHVYKSAVALVEEELVRKRFVKLRVAVIALPLDLTIRFVAAIPAQIIRYK